MSDPATIPAGPELDALVATKVMGYRKDPEYGLMSGERFLEIDGPWQPSASIAHAWEVVIHMSQRKDLDARWWNMTSGSYICIEIGADLPKSLARIMHDCPERMPLAICRAALMAVGEQP